MKQKSFDPYIREEKEETKGSCLVRCVVMKNNIVYVNLYISVIIKIFSSISYTCEAQYNIKNSSGSILAMYVLGDSLLDVGNNNYLHFSLVKADFPHNGVDFPAGPTGRFSNGKNTADFIGML